MRRLSWVLLLGLLGSAACGKRSLRADGLGGTGADAGADATVADATGPQPRPFDLGLPRHVLFRKGDLVSTEAGWVVSTDDGWVKVRTKELAHSGGSQSASFSVH